MKMRLLAVPACFAALITLAAPGQADSPGEADFLAGLKSAGISYKSGPDAVGTGRKVCQLMDQNIAQPDIVKAIIEQNPGFTTDGATRFVKTAEDKLCPQHADAKPAPPAPSSAAAPAGPNTNSTNNYYDPGTAGASGGGAPAGGGG